MLSEICKFKLEPSTEQKLILNELIEDYKGIVKKCLEIAFNLRITSRKRLHEAIYRKLRMECSYYPSHYIYTSITQALAIYKSYRKLSRKRKKY